MCSAQASCLLPVLWVSSAGPLGRAEVSNSSLLFPSNEAGFEYCTPCEETSSGQAQNWKFYFLGKFQILRHVVSKSEVSVFGGHFHHTVVTIG